MKNLENYGVVSLDIREIKEIKGGYWQFIAGAIIGGAIYDGYKAACSAVGEWHINNPGYYQHHH